MTTLRGRWAQGLEPRMFSWIIKDRLAASERPGGFARNHRKIRRQEELIWLAQNDFTRVISLLDSPPEAYSLFRPKHQMISWMGCVCRLVAVTRTRFAISSNWRRRIP